MVRFAVIALALILTGCNTTAVQTAVEAPASAPVSAGMAAISVARSSNPMYFAAPATIEVNGEKFADLAVGASQAGSVRPGPVIVTARAWSSPGRYAVRFNAEPGKHYQIAVSPRMENTVAGTVAGISGQVVEGGGPFKVEVVN